MTLTWPWPVTKVTQHEVEEGKCWHGKWLLRELVGCVLTWSKKYLKDSCLVDDTEPHSYDFLATESSPVICTVLLNLIKEQQINLFSAW